jgi:ABC-type nitrate/sulfonate/bicarbonate transport system substrate-binding protein
MRRFPPLLAAAIVLAGCGSGGSGESPRDAGLALDGRPGAVYAGLYLASQRGFDSAEGTKLDIHFAADPARALLGGRAQLAVVPLERFVRARGLVAVMALVERPLRPRPGEPDAPGLVLAVTREELTDDAGTVRAAVRALQRGYREASIDPESAVSALLDTFPRLDRQEVAARLDALGPSFQGSQPVYGRLDPAILRRWAAWAHVRYDPAAFDDRYVTKG